MQWRVTIFELGNCWIVIAVLIEWIAKCCGRSRGLENHCVVCSFVFGATTRKWSSVSSFTMFLDHTQYRATLGRTPLDEWSARCRDLYLTKHNTHNRRTSMPPVGFEPTISAGERPADLRLRPRGHWDWPMVYCLTSKINKGSVYREAEGVRSRQKGERCGFVWLPVHWLIPLLRNL